MKSPSNIEKSPIRTFREAAIVRFRDKLKEAIGGESNNSFAARCGLSEKTIRKYLKGDAYPTLDSLYALADASNKSIDWLTSGYGANGFKEKIEHHNIDNFVIIPDLNIKVAAGDGLIPLNENDSIGQFILSKEWLRRNRLLNKELAIFHVDGDSMEPTISDDDIALVSIRDDDWNSALNGVFILRVEDALFIKRIQVDLIEKGIHIISDNPMYQRNFIKLDDSTEMRIKVIAKVERILTKAIPIKQI